LEPGVHFKVRYFTEDTISPELGDMVKLTMKMDLDSTRLFSPERTLILPFDTTGGSLQAHLGRFNVGDSLSFILSQAHVKKEFSFNGVLLDEQYNCEMKIVGLIKRSDWERDQAIELAMHEEIQQVQIDEYIANSESEFEEFKGMYVSRLYPGDSVAVSADVPLYVYFVSRMLDGRVIDMRVMPDDFISYQVGMKGQLIQGLERMIGTMNINEEVELIVPFDLAFGSRGVPNDIVPPYTPLHYRLKVSDKRNTQGPFDVTAKEDTMALPS
jgi:FKBP-type peptidyl-prolyl cis-trans isomerase